MVVPQSKLQLQYRRKSQTCPLVLTMTKLEKHSLVQPESRELLLSINCILFDTIPLHKIYYNNNFF